MTTKKLHVWLRTPRGAKATDSVEIHIRSPVKSVQTSGSIAIHAMLASLPETNAVLGTAAGNQRGAKYTLYGR